MDDNFADNTKINDVQRQELIKLSIIYLKCVNIIILIHIYITKNVKLRSSLYSVWTIRHRRKFTLVVECFNVTPDVPIMISMLSIQCYIEIRIAYILFDFNRFSSSVSYNNINSRSPYQFKTCLFKQLTLCA